MAKLWANFKRIFRIYETADAASAIPGWVKTLCKAGPVAPMMPWITSLHPVLAYLAILAAVTCGFLIYATIVVVKRDKRRPVRIFGAAVYPFPEHTDDCSGEATRPHIKFHFNIINAEVEDVEIIGIQGSVLLDGCTMGDPQLVSNPSGEPLLIYQGGPLMLQLSMIVTSGGIDHIAHVTRCAGKHGSTYNFKGAVRLKVIGKHTKQTAYVSLPNPTT